MRKFSRKWKGLISLVIVCFLVFYIEVLSYIVNTHNWTPNTDLENEDVIRVLLVGDPQIIGEKGELPFLGLFTRWDADRYLQRNFMLAKYHVQPHVIAFLGDLFDEGSNAVDPEYRRYTRRFRDMFQIPRSQDPSPIEYVFLPGDNDVGGEGVEPVDPVKVKWFNQTFGDFRKELIVQRGDVKALFLKMNLILPEEYQDPMKGREHIVGRIQDSSEFRILFAHTSLLSFKTNAVTTILEKMKPQVIFSAHSHHSSYSQMEDFEIIKRTELFLHAHKHPSKEWSLRKVPSEGYEGYDPENLLLQTSSAITIKFDDKSKIVHEISVPTCSYRMGVPHSGFGAFHLYKDGTLKYTVLWLPSRFSQLYAYMAIYFVMKLSIISWLLFKLVSFIMQKARRYLPL